ncbi:hypothetical protein Gpo141_00002594 [Globisporangium polare]
MKGAKALLASWLLLCAAAVASSEMTATVALTSVDGVSAAGGKLSTAAVVGNHEIEELFVRRLSAMVDEVAEADDEATLQKQARALFDLYKKVDPELAATWGSTSETQFNTFYKKVFPKILAKAKAQRAAAKASATVVSTTKNADGTTTTTKSDGSVTTTQADGTSVTTETDGTMTTVKTDGTTVITTKDGSTTTTKADGTTVITTKDGSTTTTKADGTTVVTTKDGSTSTTKADGSSVSTKTDGTTVTKASDGTTTTSTSDGTVVTVAKDGTTTTKKADGSTTVTKTDGTTTVTKADGTTTVTTAAPGTITSPSTGTSTTPSTGTGTGTTPSTGTGTSTTPSTGTSTTPSTGTGTTPSTGSTGSSQLSVKSESDSFQVADSLSFLSQIYDTTLASNVAVLRDNTKNIETIVQSSQGGSGSSSGAANQYQAPTVLESSDAPTTIGRRLANATASKVDVLFCDIGGNAIWKWSASAESNSATVSTTTSSSTYVLDADLCTAKEVVVKVSAYQSGCSLQNHPEGCDKVYYKGCGGLTVSPGSNQIVVARTGGRSLGVLSYKDIGTTCQGRVVDAIRTYRGKKFNSPTYAEYSQKGHLYFSDSPFGLATQASDLEGDTLDKSPLREIPFNGVYLLRNGENGSEPVTLVDCFMDRPNKIAFSPKQDVMYVTNSRKGNSYVKQFALKDDGSVGNSSVLFNFTSYPELETDEGYADGIKVDEDGNIYVAVHKGVYVLSPGGTLIGVLKSSQQLSALAFGGGRMFVTGAFGVVAQSSGVLPSTAPPRAKTTCD